MHAYSPTKIYERQLSNITEDVRGESDVTVRMSVQPKASRMSLSINARWELLAGGEDSEEEEENQNFLEVPN